MTVSTASNITIPSERIVGAELVSFVKKNQHLSKSELAQATGYVTTKKDGDLRVNITAMTEALMEATGITFGKSGVTRGPGGRKLSAVARVQGNKNLLIGAAYTKQLGLEPGDQFKIILNNKTGAIRLTPVGGSDEEEQDGDMAA